MRVGSLFSGVGGFDRGLELAGHEIAFQVELDPFCQRVLAARWPGVARYGDVRDVGLPHDSGGQEPRRGNVESVTEMRVEWMGHRIDCLVGGFPCQDFSVAGKRAGLSGARSNLFYEFVRIAHALAPPWGLVENVPGLLSSHGGRDFALVLEGLRECWPVVGWRILDSQHFGVPQRRRRVFLVGGPTESGVAQVLALWESGGGDSPAGGQAGADIAYALAAGVGNRFSSGRDSQDTFVTALDTSPYADREAEHTRLVLANSLKAKGNLDHWEDSDTYVTATSTIRRLTPLECERLQGFPDGWTCLCQPLEVYAADPDVAALACRCPDSPRYRAMGNAVTVPVIAWLGRRFP